MFYIKKYTQYNITQKGLFRQSLLKYNNSTYIIL